MENNQKIKNWEKKNEELVSDIELFYKRYEEKNKEEFFKNRFKAHKQMLIISGRIFKKKIDEQVDELWELNQSFLAKTFN